MEQDVCTWRRTCVRGAGRGVREAGRGVVEQDVCSGAGRMYVEQDVCTWGRTCIRGSGRV